MSAPARPNALPAVRWRSWPVAEGGALLASWLVPVTIAAVAAAWGAGSPRWALVGAGLITLAQWRFFFPVDFELNHRGVTRRGRGRLRHIPWSIVARYEDAGWGALLVLRDGLAGGCRGLMLPYGERREAILAALEQQAKLEG